jgi:hypothetical protein
LGVSSGFWVLLGAVGVCWGLLLFFGGYYCSLGCGFWVLWVPSGFWLLWVLSGCSGCLLGVVFAIFEFCSWVLGL